LTFWPRGDGAIDGYADLLEESFGVPVEMRNHTRGGRTAENLVSRLRNDAWLRADLGEAHVITLLIPNDVGGDAQRGTLAAAQPSVRRPGELNGVSSCRAASLKTPAFRGTLRHRTGCRGHRHPLGCLAARSVSASWVADRLRAAPLHR
jgi:hypothetical protein